MAPLRDPPGEGVAVGYTTSTGVELERGTIAVGVGASLESKGRPAETLASPSRVWILMRMIRLTANAITSQALEEVVESLISTPFLRQ